MPKAKSAKPKIAKPKATNTDKRALIGAALLKLAAHHTWHNISLAQIAATAKIPLAEVGKLYASPAAILPDLVRATDQELAISLSKPSVSDTPHDRLFEILMTRFDILQRHRAALLTIINAARQTPVITRALLPAQWRSMQNMLNLAGLGRGSEQLIQRTGLLAAYGAAAYAWSQDKTPDMAKTMAVVDKSLRLMGKCAEIILRNKRA